MCSLICVAHGYPGGGMASILLGDEHLDQLAAAAHQGV